MDEDELLATILVKAEEVAQGVFHQDPDDFRITTQPTILRRYAGEWWISRPHPMQVSERIQEVADQCEAIAVIDSAKGDKEVVILAMVKGFDPAGPFSEYVGVAQAHGVHIKQALGPYPGFVAEPWKETEGLDGLPRRMRTWADEVSSVWLEERLGKLSGRGI